MSGYAVFIIEKKHANEPVKGSEPRLEPLDYGRDSEPEPDILLRRGRVAIFKTKAAAEESLRAFGKRMAGTDALKKYAFQILECRGVESCD